MSAIRPPLGRIRVVGSHDPYVFAFHEIPECGGRLPIDYWTPCLSLSAESRICTTRDLSLRCASSGVQANASMGSNTLPAANPRSSIRSQRSICPNSSDITSRSMSLSSRAVPFPYDPGFLQEVQDVVCSRRRPIEPFRICRLEKLLDRHVAHENHVHISASHEELPGRGQVLVRAESEALDVSPHGVIAQPIAANPRGQGILHRMGPPEESTGKRPGGSGDSTGRCERTAGAQECARGRVFERS